MLALVRVKFSLVKKFYKIFARKEEPCISLEQTAEPADLRKSSPG